MSDQSLRHEPRCKICNLPEELKALAGRMRFEDEASLFDICNALNEIIATRGLDIRPFSPRNFSIHFSRHAPEEQRVAYALQSVQRNHTPSASEEVFENAERYFTHSKIAGLTQELDVGLQGVRSLLERLARDLAERQKQPAPFRKGEVEPFLLAVDRLDHLAQSIHKIANPKVMVDLFLDGIFQSYTGEVAALYTTTIRELVMALKQELPGEKERSAAVELVREHGKDFHQRFDACAKQFQERIQILLSNW